MARTVTLLQLRTRVRQRMDIESETVRFTDTEVNDCINEGIARLHVEVLRERGQGYSESQTSFQTVFGQELYPLPAQFLEVTKVFTIINGCERVLRTYEQFDTDGLVEPVNWLTILDPSYRIVGDNISLRPKPTGVLTIWVNYIPTSVYLLIDANTLDGIIGYEEFVVAWACKRISMKQGDDQRIQMSNDMLGEARDAIKAIQHARNAAEPPMMTDVRPTYWNWRRRGRRYPLP